MYQYTTIQLNQREVSIDAIQDYAQPQNSFEHSTLEFVKDWLSGKDSFTFYTSGSTGAPKPYTFSRHQMQQSASRTIKALNLTAEDYALVCLNTKYIAGKMMLVRALEHQLKLTIVDPAANPFEQLPSDYQPDFMAVVPMQLQTLLHDPKNHSRLNNMKAILVGGAPVSTTLKAAAQHIDCPIYETYGMTETLSNVALRLLNTPDKTDCFKPLEGVKINLDERGCLVIHDAIQPEPLVTNDLGDVDSLGHFTWVGRYDNVINTGGIKVSPEKIEHMLDELFREIQPTFNYFIGPAADDRFGQLVTLFVDKNGLSQTDRNSIIAKICELPSSHEKPRKVVFISDWKLTETGKTDRKHLFSSLSDPKNQIIDTFVKQG